VPGVAQQTLLLIATNGTLTGTDAKKQINKENSSLVMVLL
jgi:hypothetical protein